MGSQHAYEELVMSYDLYKEIADELSMPVDPSLAPQVRYDLYTSKLVFLRNLFEQCFRIVNYCQKREDNSFGAEDLNRIHEAVDMTHSHLRETILESLQSTLNKLNEAIEK